MEMTKAKEKAEDLIVQLRELVAFLRKSVPAEDSDAQKEQLRVIGESIEHLESKVVPVPDDLFKLKKKLEADIRAAEKKQVLFFFLKEQLSQVLSDIGNHGNKAMQPEPE
jgi:hypothetical protein